MGAASSADAVEAWTKATNGKVKSFDDGSSSGGVDAGRVLVDSQAPPQYQGPPRSEPPTPPVEDARLGGYVQAGIEGVGRIERVQLVQEGGGEVKTQAQLDVEIGRANLAKLREQMMKRQEEKEALDEAARREAILAPYSPSLESPEVPFVVVGIPSSVAQSNNHVPW